MEMTRADRLMAYVEASMDTPAVWGRDGSDCSSWVARWIEAERGVRLDMPDYRDEAQARVVMADAGGLVNVWSDILGRAGISTAYAPVLGDVGVVRTSRGQSGFIYANGCVFIRADDGVMVLGPGKKTILASFSI